MSYGTKNYCEICKFEFKTFEELKNHIHEKHRAIEKREERIKSDVREYLPPHAARGAAPPRTNLQTNTRAQNFAWYLTHATFTQNGFKVKVKDGELVILKEFKILREADKEAVKAALPFIGMKYRFEE